MLRRLWQASLVTEALEIPHGRVEEAYAEVRRALIATVRDVHVDYDEVLPHLHFIYRFMARFGTVVSLNYRWVLGIIVSHGVISWFQLFAQRPVRFMPCYWLTSWSCCLSTVFSSEQSSPWKPACPSSFAARCGCPSRVAIATAVTKPCSNSLSALRGVLIDFSYVLEGTAATQHFAPL